MTFVPEQNCAAWTLAPTISPVLTLSLPQPHRNRTDRRRTVAPPWAPSPTRAPTDGWTRRRRADPQWALPACTLQDPGAAVCFGHHWLGGPSTVASPHTTATSRNRWWRRLLLARLIDKQQQPWWVSSRSDGLECASSTGGSGSSRSAHGSVPWAVFNGETNRGKIQTLTHLAPSFYFLLPQLRSAA
jgi:hypothetical protein